MKLNKTYIPTLPAIFLVAASVLVTLSVFFSTTGFIVSNIAQENFVKCILPATLLLVISLTSMIYIITRIIEQVKNRCLYIKHIFSIIFLIELVILMIYGLFLNVSSNSILAVICISANIIFLIIGIISLIKSR